jgi:pimeloyl-ACP methyl ester carboxylesterase
MPEDNRPRAEKLSRPSLDEVPIIELASWDDLEPVYGESRRYEIVRDGVKFEFFTHLKKDSPYLYAWSQGAVDRSRLDPPIFQRWSWAHECPHSVVICSDSTLYLAKINLGWCLGTAEHYYLPYYVEALHAFLGILGLSPDRLMLYGSSAGGFIALMLGGHIPEATIVVNNPQTDLAHYKEYHIAPLLEYCFGGIELTEARASYPTRLCAWELYREKRIVPNVYYLQNILDYYHYENHFKPFFRELPNIPVPESVPFTRRVRVDLYVRSDIKFLHGPLSRGDSEAAIEHGRRLFMEDGPVSNSHGRR